MKSLEKLCVSPLQMSSASNGFSVEIAEKMAPEQAG
jgi:hypothetical protein